MKLTALLVAFTIATPPLRCQCFAPPKAPPSAAFRRPRPLHSTAPPPRRPIIAGNWKLNPATLSEAQELLEGIAAAGVGSGDAEVVVFPPLPYISEALRILYGTGIQVGAQNVGPHTSGAFTGEVAPSMLSTAGCTHVLLGHSERRTIFGETDPYINASLLQSLATSYSNNGGGGNPLTVILCVGETLSEYESGLMTNVVDTQLRKSLAGVDGRFLEEGRVVIAYEPVWAIGTGLVATPEQAQAAHTAVRRTIASMYGGGSGVAERVRVQYGGSVSVENVGALMAMPDVDGALVGGASLMSGSFTDIVRGAVGQQRGGLNMRRN